MQYLEYLGQVFTGNFGTTITDNRPVTEVLLTYGTATLELVVLRAASSPSSSASRSGMLAAYRRDRWPDAVLRVFAILCYATPVFFAGLLLKLDLLGLARLAPGRAVAPSTRTELALQPRRRTTGIYLIDAISSGNPADRRRRARCTPCCPAIALGLLTAGIFLRLVRTNVIGTLST